MVSSKATPGPWRVDEYSGLRIIGRPTWPCKSYGIKGEWEVAEVEELDDHPEETAANARLITEAPAMEAALRELVEFCDDPNGSENWETLALGLARMLPNMRTILARINGGEK